LSNTQLNPPTSIRPFIAKSILYALFFSAVLLRIVYLGYSTLYHGEAENGQSAAYVLPYLKQYNFIEAIWQSWHIFPNQSNHFAQSLAINVPLAWFFGLNEFIIRVNAALGGVLSAVVVYVLVKRHSNQITALVALALITFNPYLIIFNRFGFIDSLQISCVLLGLLLLDIYIEDKRKIIYIFISSLCFSFSFLFKLNSIISISIFLILYLYYYKLTFKDIFLISIIASIFIYFLFFDQIDMLHMSIMKQAGFSTLTQVSLSNPFSIIKDLLSGVVFNVTAHARYFELTALPLIVSLLFWRKIDNKFFNLLILFSVFYFAVLVFQGRYFFRYFQIGVITSSIALAFPLSYLFTKRHYYIGIIMLTIFMSWNLFTHRSYVSAVFHHIPYKYIEKRANEIRGDGRIMIYGRNSESEYYLSPTNNLIFDETINLAEVKVPLFNSDYPTWPNVVRKIPPERDILLDDITVQSGDVVVIHGMHMNGGEPAPRLHGYDGRGFRVYRHDLSIPQEFHNSYIDDSELPKVYKIEEKIYLTNGSNELAALILRKY